MVRDSVEREFSHQSTVSVFLARLWLSGEEKKGKGKKGRERESKKEVTKRLI